ncbi:MAG: DUF3375 domain-containing protein [Ectothiorhodospiraceae bacterium]|nr:DUF3375 domain-containing protein [Ectothiorhodospiraceae bacterium]
MSFVETNARYRRLLDEQVAWKLLRADSAPFILAFLADLFAESSEVPFGEARAALDAELDRARDDGTWEGADGAASYLRRWIQAGWLRELDDALSMTDGCEVALRFVRGLDQRDTHSTASHLRVVQDAVRDLAAALSPSAEKRIDMLEARMAELQRELDDLHAGLVRELSEDEQRERIREVYQLAALLNGDFRRVEDDIRRLDQALRVHMIQSGVSRGDVLGELIGQEDLLARSDAGRAFRGFFRLLMDENRTTELREQLREILASPAARYLNPAQHRFLGRLMRELARETERVFQVRRRTESGLRAFVESGAAAETRAVGRLLSELERVAVELREAGVSPRTALDFTLPSGPARVSTVDQIRLRHPGEELAVPLAEPVTNARTPSAATLEQLYTVKVLEVANRMRDSLRRRGPQTVGALLHRSPLVEGLEELVAHIRVARAVGATELEDHERVLVTDRRGHRVSARIPRLLLHAELFPARIEELPL